MPVRSDDQPHAVPERRIARRVGAGLAASTALLLGAGLAACDPFVEGNGVLREETRVVAAFAGLAVSDGIEVAVTGGAAEQSVRVSGDENVLQHVETEVEARAAHGAVLVVRSSASYESRHPLRVAVAATALGYLAADEASPVSVAGAASELLTVEASDGSILSLAGPGGERLVLVLAGGKHGGARLDARGYPVAEAVVTLTGGAVAAVSASASAEGSAADGSLFENVGAGTCAVTATDGARVTCAAP